MKVEPEPSRAAVVFEDDRTPPVDHLPLHVDRTRQAAACTAARCRAEIELATLGLRQLQHADKHGRHPLAMGDPVLLDQPQGALRASKRSITTAVPPMNWVAIHPDAQPRGRAAQARR